MPNPESPQPVGFPIRYWSHVRNIGDTINPYIVKHLTGLDPFFQDDYTREHLLAVGSVFFVAENTSHIWGSGILLPNTDLSRVDITKVHAVRGHLTLQKLRDHFGTVADLPLGDPSIFADELPDVVRFQQEHTITHRVAVVPHHDWVAHDYIRMLGRNDDVVVLSPTTDRLDFLRGIISAEYVVSQSLHGLVFAEIFGKPHVWINHRDRSDLFFKFADWFSTTQEPIGGPIVFGPDLDTLLRHARLTGSTIDREALRQSLPKLTPVPTGELVRFDAIRRMAPLKIVVERNFYTPTTIDAYDTFVVRDGHQEEDNRAHLTRLRGTFSQDFCFILIHDQELFQSVSSGFIDTMRSVIDYNHTIAFVTVTKAPPSGAAPPVSLNSNKGRVELAEWNRSYLGRGFTMFRGSRYFDWNRTGAVAPTDIGW